MTKIDSKMHTFMSIFPNFSRRKFRKDFLPIFHAILFAENEILHDHWSDKVARGVASKGGWGCIPHRNLETKINVKAKNGSKNAQFRVHFFKIF